MLLRAPSPTAWSRLWTETPHSPVLISTLVCVLSRQFLTHGCDFTAWLQFLTGGGGGAHPLLSQTIILTAARLAAPQASWLPLSTVFHLITPIWGHFSLCFPDGHWSMNTCFLPGP